MVALILKELGQGIVRVVEIILERMAGTWRRSLVSSGEGEVESLVAAESRHIAHGVSRELEGVVSALEKLDRRHRISIQSTPVDTESHFPHRLVGALLEILAHCLLIKSEIRVKSNGHGIGHAELHNGTSRLWSVSDGSHRGVLAAFVGITHLRAFRRTALYYKESFGHNHIVCLALLKNEIVESESPRTSGVVRLGDVLCLGHFAVTAEDGYRFCLVEISLVAEVDHQIFNLRHFAPRRGYSGPLVKKVHSCGRLPEVHWKRE